MTWPTESRVLKLLRETFLALAVCGVFAVSVSAHEPEGAPRSQDLRAVAERISGGATLLAEIQRDRQVEAFQQAAHHFERRVDDDDTDREHLAEDWRELREAFERIRGLRRSRDDRFAFLLPHLEEDMRAGDRILGGGYTRPDRPREPGRHAFIQEREVCVGGRRGGPRPCPGGREQITFRVPRDVEVIRTINAEWRDFGEQARAQVYLNHRLIWETDVKHNWETDGRTLNISIPRGSTLTLRSSNGDPMWVRRLEIDYATTGAREANPWWSVLPELIR